jgi:glycosyltransferase involved in cell wall biosynthesis
MTLNEVVGMKAIMPSVDRSWVDQIIVVDGGSSDGTIEWAKQNGYEVYVQKKKGFRHAYNEVWPLITGDVVITFSPDGNSIAALIPDLITKMKEGYDMVIASRYLGDAKSEDDDIDI